MFAHVRSLARVSLALFIATSANSAEPSGAEPVGGHATSQFVRSWDEDGDDKVSRAEYVQIAEERKGSVQQTDTRFRDGDGDVTKEQFDAQRASAFTATDANRDGKLDQSEYLQEFVARLDQQIKLRRHDQLKQGGIRFKSIDDDKNGVISREEYVAMSSRTFARADTNKDGVVSMDDPAPAKRDRDEKAASLMAATHAASAAESSDAEAPKPLGTIKVTVDEEEGRSAVGNSTVVGSDRLEAEQAQNFEDAVRYVPGVTIVDLGRFGDNGFNIRGLEGDRVALTIDNLPIAETVETTPAYEFFRAGRGSVDIDAVKSIEVVKGADSITAGSGALGGAVMLTTKDPADYLDSVGNGECGPRAVD